MLSKEEYTPIELREHCIKTMQISNRNSNAYKEHELMLSIMDENISMKYELDQLKSDKQKLIEKLEERIRYFEENDELLATTYDNYSDGTVTKRIIDELRRLLLIVKGVENERDKI